jgi:hypothetical protein
MGDDDMLVDPDDEIVGTRGIAGRRRLGMTDGGIPKVTDELGESVRETFEQFLET